MTSDSTTDLAAAGPLADLAAAEVVLGRLWSVLFRVGSDQLGEVLAQLRRVAALADATSVAVVAEATGRGVAAGGQPGSLARTWTREWVQRNCPRTDPATITRLVTLGNMAQHASRRVLTDAVTDGRVGLVTAAVALTEYERLEPEVSPTAREDTLRGYVDIAVANDPAVVRRMRPEFLARFGANRQLEKTIDRLRAQRHLSGPVEFDQLTHYALTLDPEGAARLEAGLDLLSAPAPTVAEADLRSSGQRRADALLTLIARAVAAGGAAHAQPKAQLVITIPMNDLRSGVTGCGRSIGRTSTAVLDPETVRQVGCDAETMLMALGAKTEPLALGRSRRLVAPALLKALWVRDGGCTYPECHAPPAWSDAHHIRHWADGGRTDLNNLALLCGRHHTKIHKLSATAEITHGRIRWNL